MLFECLTGAPPFRKDTEVATIYAHLEEDAPKVSSKRPGISPLLSSAVTKAMAKRPEDRFATASDMAEALRGRALKPGRPGRRWIAAAAAAVVLAAGAIAAVMTTGDGEPSASSTGPSRAAGPC